MTPTPRPESDSYEHPHFKECRERIRSLTAELAEAKREIENVWRPRDQELYLVRVERDEARKERDAALAEMKSAASDALNTFEINEVLKKELTEARAEAKAQDEIHWKTRRALIKERDAARANCEQQRKLAMDNWQGMCEARAEAKALRAAVNKAMDLLEDNPDGPQLDLAYDVLNQALGATRRADRDGRPHQWAEGGFCNTHMTYGCGKARLAPAPAPKTDNDQLWFEATRGPHKGHLFRGPDASALQCDYDKRPVTASEIAKAEVMRKPAPAPAHDPASPKE
jgi:hypothetical protein